MNSKIILPILGTALVPAIAVTTSISLTPDSHEDLVEKREEKTTPTTPTTPTTHKKPALKKHVAVKGFRQKSSANREGYYISKYQDYFLDNNSNRDLWEANFNNLKDSRSGKISILGDDEDNEDGGQVLVATIEEPWNAEHSFDHYSTNLNFPLNVFCGEWYTSEGWASGDSWTFQASSSSVLSGIETPYFWKLCSAFNKKPETISEEKTKLKSIYSDTKLIGNKLKTLLVAINNNDAFWQLRQEEWKNLQSNNSTYFEYKEDKSIKDLCGAAYKKEPAPGTTDSVDAPTLDNAKKYCSLEWNFQTR